MAHEYIINSEGNCIRCFKGVHLPGRPSDSCYDVHVNDRWKKIESITDSISDIGEHNYRVMIPSLCHPHIHLDKCFLLSHPKYADLEIQKGDFSEAMRLSSEAKSRFEHDDLMDRGRALIEESIKFGVTHMRAFVEVDFGVEMKCLDAGLELKAEFRDKCYIQICVFAQDPIFSHDHGSRSMTDLLENAIQKHGVEVLGSTPYVEKSLELQEENMKWTIETAKLYQLHLDFHLDYHLNEHQKPMVYSAIERLHRINWTTNYEQKEFRTVVFGHCTRLTLLDGNEWHKLRQEIRDLPVSFVGLPTSDLFMMGRPDEATGGSNRVRGTLQVVEMIKKYDFNAAIGINNVGNAFTPQGTCDPMGLTSLGVGIYQAGTKADAQILLECVSTRARQAIGIYVEHNINSNLDIGSPSSFVIFGTKGSRNFRARKSIQELVYDAGFERTTIFEGKEVSSP